MHMIEVNFQGPKSLNAFGGLIYMMSPSSYWLHGLLNIHSPSHRCLVGCKILSFEAVRQNQLRFFFTMDRASPQVVGVSGPDPGSTDHLPSLSQTLDM